LKGIYHLKIPHMLTLPERILFIIALLLSAYFSYRNFSAVFEAIKSGKDEKRKFNLWRGIQAFFLQRPVFKARFITSVFHFFVVWAFIIYAFVNLQDVLRGYFREFNLFGETPLQVFFNLVADVISFLALIGVIYFGIRRFVYRDKRLYFPENVPLHENVKSGILRDSLIVLLFIFTHVFSRVLHQALSLEGFDPYQPFSSSLFILLSPMPEGLKVLLEHIFWWLAIGSILAFFPYFPYSKHIHLFFAPVRWSFRREKPYAYLEPLNLMEKMQEEGGEEETFGAINIKDLPWASIMDAFACIMCNRCQDVCPANFTGKPLSPSALIINLRYELNGKFFDTSKARPLMDFAINEDALWACTTCGACVEICPVGNEQLYTILQIRRGQVLMEGKEAGLSNAYKGMENQGNPWNMPHSDREKWLEGLDVVKAYEGGDFDVLYWAGCAAAYDQRYSKVVMNFINLLKLAGIRVAVLGKEERCTGDSARRTGNEYLFEMLAIQNVETLNSYKPKVIVTSCPHCYHTIKNEYPDFGLEQEIKVYHHTEYLAMLIREGKLKVEKDGKKYIFHDPCYLGRHNGVYEEPRFILKSLGDTVEAERSRGNSFCCGAGGGRMWLEEKIGKKINLERTEELLSKEPDEIVVGCPFCLVMITDGVKAKGLPPEKVKDISEVISENLKG